MKEPKWKTERALLNLTPHKFDYIDVDDFSVQSVEYYVSYAFIYVLTFKSILIYMADIAILIIMLSDIQEVSKIWATGNGKCDVERYGAVICSSTFKDNFKEDVGYAQIIPIAYRLGIIMVSILISFFIIIIEWRKALRIVKSRDISFSMTSTIVYRYYCIQSYAHFCFFRTLKKSRRLVDILAFHCFFTFKGWKRLILAELPRQLIYFLFVVDIIRTEIIKKELRLSTQPMIFKHFIALYNHFVSLNKGKTDIFIQQLLMISTVLLWIISAANMIVAFFIYVPLLFEIRGNLKEYCCHKLDKRFEES